MQISVVFIKPHFIAPKNPSFWTCLQGTLEPALLQLLLGVEQASTHVLFKSHRHQGNNYLFAKLFPR